MRQVCRMLRGRSWAWLVPVAFATFCLPAAAQRGDAEVRLVRTMAEAVEQGLLKEDGSGIGNPWQPPAAPTPKRRSVRVETFLESFTPGFRPVILMTGYWPPTNEMVRQFSPTPALNPLGWVGRNWENRGYDVVSFFPEFTPPNCSNCGVGMGDLEVDYQDTSADFWNIVQALKPVAIITFSRGFNNVSWEVEMNQFNRQFWVNDFIAPFQPTPAPPDAGHPTNGLRLSTLPAQEIVDAVDAAALNLTPYICFTQDGGGFLSEFIAYHGVWYQALHANPDDPAYCVTAGHVHVGTFINWPTATTAAEITLRVVIRRVEEAIGQPKDKPITFPWR